MTDLLTDVAIRAALKSGREQFLPDSKERGTGRLMLRVKAGKGYWMFRYNSPSKGNDKIAIGPFRGGSDPVGKGYTLKTAREKAREYEELLKNPDTRDIRDLFRRREAEALDRLKRETEQVEAAEREARAAREHTLRALLTIYCQDLVARGKSSAKDVEGKIKSHLFSKRPDFCDRRASLISSAEIAAVIRKIREQNGERTAGLIRSYLFSAYELATHAETDTAAPSELVDFRIAFNPVAAVKSIPVKRRTQTLSLVQTRAFITRAVQQRGLVGTLIAICMLAGGQRPLQVSRVKFSDYDATTGHLTVVDEKGKRSVARVYIVPLAPQCQALMAWLIGRAKMLNTQYLFSADGTTQFEASTISRWVTRRSQEMVASGEFTQAVTTRDLRRTMSTLLANLGVSKDVRGHLMSNGQGDIQSARYDQHDYLEEKKAALLKLEAELNIGDVLEQKAAREHPAPRASRASTSRKESATD